MPRPRQRLDASAPSWFRRRGHGHYACTPGLVDPDAVHDRLRQRVPVASVGIDDQAVRGDRREQRLHVLGPHVRSEEPTSELQSLMRISYAVLRLRKTSMTSSQLSLMSLTSSENFSLSSKL